MSATSPHGIKIAPADIPDVLIVETPVYTDPRGLFSEMFHAKKFAEAGFVHSFVQDNRSLSRKGVIRGLHYQRQVPQGKLVGCAYGEIFDVAVDLRRSSPTFGKWTGTTLSGENGRQMFIPEGFAHGFCALSETALVVYKCTDFFAPDDDRGIFYADPDIGVDWPVEDPVVSEKDRGLPLLSSVDPETLFD
ncbi:MAG: dTDP-4-dehydrorhamnose 3,5-epimerase [Deltaproteobacteria bacterium]|nr:dTDP-4-dehydrorhamnose 3,5-epimerase [Deltaproteobacteria bacterium]